MLHPERLDVATPERVSLRLPVAGFGFRSLAYLIDAAIIFLFWVVLYFVTSLIANAIDEFQALSSLGRSLFAFAVFAAQWCYWTVSEIAMNGQTFGKRLMRIRVVRLDGSPVTPVDSALRNLIRFVDFLPFGYSVGLITMLFNKDNRRVGDLVAGTVLARDEKVDLSRYLNTTAQPTASATEQELLLDFLQRAPQLLPEPRARLATRFAQRYCGNLGAEDRARVLSSSHAAESFLRDLTQSR